MSVRVLPYVLPEVLGCPNVVAKNYVVRAAIELCQIGHVWQYDHANITVTGGTTPPISATLSVTSGAVTAKVLEAVFDDTPLVEAGLVKLQKEYTDWRAETGFPAYHFQRSATTLTLVPAPDSNGTLRCILALKPDGTSNTLPDALVTQHMMTLAAGAKYFLMMMPGQKWSNPALAEYYKGQFYGGIGRANFESGGPIEVEPCV